MYQGFHILNRNLLASLVSIVLMIAASHYVPRIVLIYHSRLLGASFVETLSLCYTQLF